MSTTRTAALLVVVALSLVVGAACSRSAPVAVVRQAIATPALDDRGDVCADVGEARACWGSDLVGPGCDGKTCALARPVPAGPAPVGGWRCDGSGGSRVCEERSRNAGSWDCEGRRCVQRRPRMPDDGEWECVDVGGIVYCRGGLAAAGVVAGAADRGWMCGSRPRAREEREGREEREAREEKPETRGTDAKSARPVERVCVDFSPDLPPLPGVFHCRFQYPGPGPERVCDDQTTGARPGDACASARDCPSGLGCTGGRCLPSRPDVGCWLDVDCGGSRARCRWGTCT